MSNLHRQAFNQKNASYAALVGLLNPASPGRSRSRPTSRSGSQANSRASSKVRSMLSNEEEANSEYFGSTSYQLNLDELILSRATSPTRDSDSESVYSSEDESVRGEHSYTTPSTRLKNAFDSCIETLSLKGSSTDSRESSLALIYKILSNKCDVTLVTEELIILIQRSLQNGKSDMEIVLSARCLTVLGSLNIDETSEILMSSIIPSLSRLISDSSNRSVDVRSNAVAAYSLLLFLYLDGSGSYGIDEKIGFLIDTAEHCNADESLVASFSILGAGLLVTLLEFPNTLIEDYIVRVVDLLETTNKEVKLACGKVIALFYEIFHYNSDNFENNPDDADEYEEFDSNEYDLPYLNNDSLLSTLRHLSTDSSKKVSKKDKRERHSLFRNVYTTVESYSTREGRQSISDTTEDISITHLKLTKNRSLNIDSWSKLIRVQYFRWIFGEGLQTQIANNTLVSELIKQSSPKKRHRSSDRFGDVEERLSDFSISSQRIRNGKERAIALSKARDAKKEPLF